MRVAKTPSSSTVPSFSAIRTYSPTFNAREYIRIKPAPAWATILDEPSETIRPTRTESVVKASDCAPGRYGYAIARAKTQRTAHMTGSTVYVYGGVNSMA